MSEGRLPGGLEHLLDINSAIGRRAPAFFLDFDGTLAPISPTPAAAAMSAPMRDLVARLARRHLVCILSGRGLNDLQTKVGLATVYYAADHGHRIVGPEGSGIELEVAPEDTLELETASYALDRRLRDIEGVEVEVKDLSLSVHYRRVAQQDRPLVEDHVRQVAAASPGLRLSGGKLVHELRPELGWDKGKAMVWLVKRLGLRRPAVCPICLGDDRTDEDMFQAARGWGVSLVVGCAGCDSRADYELSGVGQVADFLRVFADDTSYSTRPRG